MVVGGVLALPVAPRTGPWTAQEDELLITAVQGAAKIRGLFNAPGGRNTRISWVKVSEAIQGLRSPTQCRERWTSVVRHKVVPVLPVPVALGGSGDDDDSSSSSSSSRTIGIHLTTAPSYSSSSSSSAVPVAVGGGVGAGANAGSSTKRVGHWTVEEDEQLVVCVRQFINKGIGGGVSWVHVSHAMGNGRSPNQCYKRWNVSVKHKVSMELLLSQSREGEQRQPSVLATSASSALPLPFATSCDHHATANSSSVNGPDMVGSGVSRDQEREAFSSSVTTAPTATIVQAAAAAAAALDPIIYSAASKNSTMV
jgi:hypothetical protein